MLTAAQMAASHPISALRSMLHPGVFGRPDELAPAGRLPLYLPWPAVHPDLAWRGYRLDYTVAPWAPVRGR